MRITLYKYYKKLHCDSATDGFDNTEILTERQLREMFVKEYKNFHKDNISQYEILNNLDMSNDNDKWTVFDTDLAIILEIFSNNDQYDPNNDYLIDQEDIEFNEYEDCYD